MPSFLILGGQIHNSSGWPSELPQVWESMAALHANTIEAPVYWEQFEPREGQFDYTNADQLVEGARAHNLHVVLLWFGTWKNGNMHYVPAWVKNDSARFSHVVRPDGEPIDVLSPNARNTLEADKVAFVALMRHLSQIDGEAHTVLLIQVENESGTKKLRSSQCRSFVAAGHRPQPVSGRKLAVSISRVSSMTAVGCANSPRERTAAWHGVPSTSRWRPFTSPDSYLQAFGRGRHKRDSNQYLNATSALPLWVCAAACIAANCGSLDVFAMMALGAQYGMLACHLYWIGAIPAFLAVAFRLFPAYKRSRNPTFLDFISRHYGSSTRSVVALCMAAMMLLIAGVALCAVAQIVSAFLGWTFVQGVMVAATIVLFYTWFGGFRATVYTELIHFAMVLVAVVPLPFLVAHQLGGFRRMMAGIPTSRVDAWQSVPVFAPHAVMDRVGLVFGLGLVLSFGYWGTDFVQMQRALAVRREQDAPFVPLSIGFAKLVFAVLIAITGVAAPLVLSQARLSTSWNATLPALMLHYCESWWLLLGFMGLAASLISTFSNNVAGFTSVWVQGIYQEWIRPHAADRHYFRISRLTNAAAVVFSVGAAYFALSSQSLMDYIQFVLSTFNAPLIALVALTAVAPRGAAAAGHAGFLIGLACAFAHQILSLAGVLHYGSQMAANFYGAIFGFCVTMITALWIGSLRAAAQGNPAGNPLPINGVSRSRGQRWQPALPWLACSSSSTSFFGSCGATPGN